MRKSSLHPYGPALAFCLCLIVAAAALPHRAHAYYDGSLSEYLVRKWFDSFSLHGLSREALFCEFHPIDGTLVARYTNTSGTLILVSFVDNKRKHPVYGLPRSAKDIVSVGADQEAKAFSVNDVTWYGDDASGPILAVDVTEDIKVVMVGWEGVDLEEMVEFARELPITALSEAAM